MDTNFSKNVNSDNAKWFATASRNTMHIDHQPTVTSSDSSNIVLITLSVNMHGFT